MSEGIPKNLTIEEINSEEINDTLVSKEAVHQREVGRLLEQAIELTRHERFPFTRIKQEYYDKMKAADDECPGYSTPVVEIKKRMEDEGMKISLGKNPESGNIFVMPGKSDDFENDSIELRAIELNTALSEKVEEIRSLIKAIQDLNSIHSKK